MENRKGIYNWNRKFADWKGNGFQDYLTIKSRHCLEITPAAET